MSNEIADLQAELRDAETKIGVAESFAKRAQSGLMRNRIWSMLAGAVAIAIVGHWFPGYQLDSSAETSSNTAAENAVGDVMAQLCVERFMAESGLDERLVELNAAVGDWSQANFIRDGSWAIRPDGEKTSHDSAKKCRSLIAERVMAQETKKTS